MKSNQWLLALMLGCAAASNAPVASAAEERISDEARNYFRNGVELLQSTPPNYQDAYYQFKLAYEKSKSWKVLGNLGLCAVKLERDGEALKYYDEYLKGGGKQIDREEREAIERDMLLIRGNTASVELSSPSAEVEIRDVRVGSSATAQSYNLEGGKQTLLLRAGSHTLTAINKDGRELRWEVLLSPGRSVSHVFDFDAPAPSTSTNASASTTSSVVGAPPSPPVPVAPPSSGSWFSPLRITGLVASGVGLAVVGAGVVTGLRAKDREELGNGKCNDSVSPPVCDESAEKDFDDAASLARTANILYITGGVVSAVGLGLVIFGGSTPAEVAKARPLKLTPVIGAGGGGLFASGTF